MNNPLSFIFSFCRSAFLILLFSSGSVFAAFAPPLVAGWSTAGAFGATPAASCAAYVFAGVPGYLSSVDWFGDPWPASSGYLCKAANSWQVTSPASVAACPANSTGSTSCTCSAGYVENASHTACIIPPDPNKETCAAKAGTSAGFYTADMEPSEGVSGPKFTNMCDPAQGDKTGCHVSVVYDFGFQSTSGGQWGKNGKGTFSGSTCTMDATSDGTGAPLDPNQPAPLPPVSPADSPVDGPKENPCGAGSVPGTVNGVQGCSPSSGLNIMAPVKSEAATSASGSASAPTSGLGADAPPSATSSKTDVACTGDKCTTTTTFNDAAGAVVGTKTETGSKAGFCQENQDSAVCGSGGVSGGSLPAGPELYEPKYPDGLGGVWDAKITELKDSPLFELTDTLMPNIASGGTCPAWLVPLDLGLWSFGSYDVAPPCWIWDFAKVIVIISSLLLARALIFGG